MRRTAARGWRVVGGAALVVLIGIAAFAVVAAASPLHLGGVALP